MNGLTVNFGDSRLPESFWSKVQPCPMSGCWLWSGTLDKDGFGKCGRNGSRARPTTHDPAAHRRAFSALVSPIAKGAASGHVCRIRSCVNPAHILVGDHSAFNTIGFAVKHGRRANGAASGTYYSWTNMKQRCLNPKAPSFQNYGRRGITICRRWADSYEAFLADMGEKPSSVHSIDRINNDGNYEPSNCRWATPKQQSNNQRPRRKRAA